ncbi:hypothetical protein BHE74_00055206 [Ensete ventricosum]|nr:hypothetical protein BHE74_00055206 [Ensete ventricosum]
MRWDLVWGFARRFIEGIGKLAGNTKGDCREEDRKTCRKNVGCCRIMLEIWAMASSFLWVNRLYHRIWVATNS